MHSCEGVDDGLELVWSSARMNAVIAANNSDLDIIAVDAILHDVLQSLQDHLLGLDQGHR